MPCFCIGKYTSFRQILAKMVATRQSGPLLGTQSNSCTECLSGIEFDNWMYFAAISLPV